MMSLPIFLQEDLPSGATHHPQKECGFSLYYGILIQWDEDRDTRILSFINDLPPEVRGRLLVVQEHEAGLALLWDGEVPPDYEEGAEFEVQKDYWNVLTSTAITRRLP